ncbi:hypothetical protein Zmor_011268 [Zophobas morio]|uniref:Uncharacterized protein n=1 Tax=Zophobas morio TaxID=2755281 RepID=A0AA38MJD1_9CUCU|nr:hypothetical protein Zmor_011268 [Zophobas morio]
MKVSSENILEQIKPENNRTYFPNGSPNITSEGLFENVKTFTFIPEKVPNHPNYKFNVTLETIEKCSDLDHCWPLYPCENAKVIDGGKLLEKDMVFISWQLVNQTGEFILTILFQYQNRLVKCVDQNAIKLKKVVLQGKKLQQFQSKSVFYKYTNTADVSHVNCSIDKTAVAIHYMHCESCGFKFDLNCSEAGTTTNKYNTTYQFSEYSLSNPQFKSNFGGWKKHIIKSEAGSCNLTINRTNNGNPTKNDYWFIAFIDPHEQWLDSYEEKSTTTPDPPTHKITLTTTTKQPTTNIYPNKDNAVTDSENNSRSLEAIPTLQWLILTILLIVLMMSIVSIVLVGRNRNCRKTA